MQPEVPKVPNYDPPEKMSTEDLLVEIEMVRAEIRKVEKKVQDLSNGEGLVVLEDILMDVVDYKDPGIIEKPCFSYQDALKFCQKKVYSSTKSGFFSV